VRCQALEQIVDHCNSLALITCAAKGAQYRVPYMPSENLRLIGVIHVVKDSHLSVRLIDRLKQAVRDQRVVDPWLHLPITPHRGACQTAPTAASTGYDWQEAEALLEVTRLAGQRSAAGCIERCQALFGAVEPGHDSGCAVSVDCLGVRVAGRR
jgi:hypothetical protein